MRVTIYQKPTCTSCRAVAKALKEASIDVETVNYFIDPISRSKLVELLRKMNMPARELLRRNEPVYKELNIAGRVLSDDELIDLMVHYPDLIQRPIVENGPRAILARPAERLREIL
jgi:arsenate reductase